MSGFGSVHFLTRQRAAQHIKDKGVPIGVHSLAYLATNGRGPRYAVINGRAVYTPGDLDAWLESEAARSRREARL